jgi:hypothetical protein
MGQRSSLMKNRRHTPEQIVRKLREADRLLGEGMELPELLFLANARAIAHPTGGGVDAGTRVASQFGDQEYSGHGERRDACFRRRDRSDAVCAW